MEHDRGSTHENEMQPQAGRENHRYDTEAARVPGREPEYPD